MKIKKIFFLSILVLLLLGVSYATEANNDTLTTTDTSEVVKETSTTTNIVDNVINDETKTKEIQKQTNNNKTIKTTSKSYDVTDFNTLHSALTTGTYDTVTVNIKSNIKLTDNTELNEAIKTLTINGNGETINGNQYQFLYIGKSTVKINNLKITNCYGNYGGAIRNEYGKLILTNSTLNRNTADRGGSLYVIGGSLSISNTLFNNNNASNGGVIFNKYGTLTIKDSTLYNNTASNYGGVIVKSNNGGVESDALNIVNSKLYNNTATYGGTIYTEYATLNINKSNFYNNKATYGGAIDSYLTQNMIDNSKLYNNMATYAGAIRNNYANLSFKDTALYNNIASNSGVILNLNANLTMLNCTLNNNTGTLGGVISNTYSNSTINATKIFNNKATNGGAIYNGRSNLNITDSILYNNNATDGGAILIDEGNLTITGSKLYNNTATDGGAIYNYKCTLNINSNNLYNNKASNAGGAIFNENSTGLIENNIFENNTVKTNGAAIYNNEDCNLTIKNNKFIVNKGQETIYNNYSNKLINNTFIDQMIINNVDMDINNNIIIISGNIINQHNKTVKNDVNISVKLDGQTIINKQIIKNGNIKFNFTNPSNNSMHKITITIHTTDNYIGTEKTIKLLPTIIYASSNGIGSGTSINDPTNMTTALTLINNGYKIILVSNKTTDTYNYDIHIDSSTVKKGTDKFTIEAHNNKTITIKGKIYISDKTVTLNNIIFDGENKNNGRINASNSVLIINNCTFKNHLSNNGGAIYHQSGKLTIINSTFNNNKATNGGAIYNDESILLITNCTFNNNKANNSGGAIYNYRGDMDITDNAFINNMASNNGGAIMNDGAYNTYYITHYDDYGRPSYTTSVNNHYGNLFTNNNRFFNNSASNGGSISLDCNVIRGIIHLPITPNNLGVLINNSEFTNNEANENGGAIHNDFEIISITHSTLKNNKAKSSGGAIYNDEGDVNAINNTFFHNSALNNGGAIDNSAACLKLYGESDIDYYGNLFADNNCYFNNSASNGGAISLKSRMGIVTFYRPISPNRDVVIFDSEFTNNAAYNQGGSIWVESGNYTFIHNNTYNSNKADKGGAIFISDNCEDNTTINVCKFSENIAKDGSAIYNEGNEIFIGSNTFIKNIANATGKAIIDNGHTIIENNINADKSSCASTIYTKGNNVVITNNTFDDGKKLTILTVGSTKTVPVGSQMSVYGKLTDKDGENLAYQLVKIRVDGKTYTTNTTQYGNYNIKITPTTRGTKKIMSVYAGSATYLNSSASSTFVVKEGTIITVGSSKTVPVGSQMSIYGKLTDNEGDNLAYQKVTVSVGGKTYIINTTQYGNYNIKITPTTTGTKTILATYGGSAVYMDSSASSSFVVKEGTVITVGSSATVNVGSQMSVYGKLTDKAGNNLAYQQVKITVDGKTITTNTTRYGNYNIKITPTTAGTKTILVAYAGSAVYMDSSASSTFVVKEGTVITVGSLKTVPVGSQMSVYGKLTDKAGNNLAYQQVKITVDGKTITTNTTRYGNYNIKITPTTAGTKTILATYAGSIVYVNSSASSSFVVKEGTVITVGSSATVNVGSQMSVYGKLTDVDGKNLAYQLVTISVDGKTYSVNTTQYGNFNIKITPTTGGTKTITAKFAGTVTYNGSSATSTFSANKVGSIITVGSTKTVTVGKQMSVYGKLTDKDGNNLAYQPVRINVDGKTYNVNTTQYGNYNIKITPTTTGTKTITTSYAGTVTYKNSKATSTFQVIKS